MNQLKRALQAIAGDRPLLRQQVLLVVVFAALALLAMLLPLQDLHIPRKHYLPLHTLLEFASILTAFLVFATVWHTPSKEASSSLLLIAVALFAAGWLDFAHALSFVGMPDLMTPASSEKSIALWLAARLLVAVSLLAVSFYPQLRPPSAWARSGILAAYTLVNLVVLWRVIFHEADLPVFFIKNMGLTPFKVGLEWFITGLLVLSAWRYHRVARQSEDEALPWIFGAASVAALSEFFFTQYGISNDSLNFLGHLYKFVSYGLLYQAMFVVSVRRPYQRLAAKTQSLLKVNEALRIQSLALESTATPVVVSDLEGRVRWRNRASSEICTIHSSDFENKLLLFSAPFTPDPKVAESIRATVQAGNIWRGLIYLKNAQDNSIVMDRTVTPLRNEDGVIEGYVSVGENVTERVKAQLRHKRVLDTALDGFWITDTQGRLLEVNHAYARMSGYTVEELLTMNMSQLEAVERLDEVQAHRQKIIQLGCDQFETRHRHKQGHEFTVDISATYDPESMHLFVFARDRSERVQAAAVKQDLERQLQQSQKMQALGQLTGGIAHDFNNILAAILGYSNLALDRFVPDKQSKLATYLREVIGASERARDLVAKMLTFTRTQPNASADVISPSVVIAEVLAMMRPSIPSSIQLKSRIDDELHIRMDAGELNQMLVNLIINARDAVEGLGMIEIRLHRVEIKGQICASCQQRLAGAYLALEVSDNGSGIAPEHLPRLFDPFFTTKDIGKGTGLGLSMVQGILRRSGGHIVVESQLGRGSRFQLLFPIALPADVSPGVPQSDPKAKFGMGQHIWVVDDEPAVARFFGELLENWGYSVRLFNDPAEVLAAFEAGVNDIDLLITDQTMPGLSGVALALRLHSVRPNLPIVLCTGYSDGIDRSDVLRHGIRRYFSKPVLPHELLNAIAEELASK
ncbi:MASE3 domain-containing protein [Rhodoferax sp.]|uniref:hybrid sensor histidine kinase/response regulator n=1 Tax=Rhodoferax sp. TaxID=50421 RepID=UPI003453532A